MRKKIGRIFSSRIFFAIFAILASVALWMYVEYTENEPLNHTVNDIPIVFRNEASLRDRGLLISAYDPPVIGLTFSDIPRSIATRLTNQTLSVEVDLFAVTRPGAVHLTYEIIYPTGADGVNPNAFAEPGRSVENISFHIDRLSMRTIPVLGEYTGGTASEDLIAEPIELHPASISIEGPEEIILRINHARVNIYRENLSTTYIDDLPFVLMDEYGDEVSSELLEDVTTSTDSVHVTVPVRRVKEVPLSVRLVHGAGSSEQFSRVTFNPPFITVSGEPEALEYFNTLDLGPIDMTSFALRGEVDMAIPVPGHIRNDSGETMARVTVETLQLEMLDLFVENLSVINTPPGYAYDIIPPGIEVRLRGRAEDLEGITPMHVRVVADLRDLSPGRVRALANVYIDGTAADIGAIGEYRILLRILPEAELLPEVPIDDEEE